MTIISSSHIISGLLVTAAPRYHRDVWAAALINAKLDERVSHTTPAGQEGAPGHPPHGCRATAIRSQTAPSAINYSLSLQCPPRLVLGCVLEGVDHRSMARQARPKGCRPPGENPGGIFLSKYSSIETAPDFPGIFCCQLLTAGVSFPRCFIWSSACLLLCLLPAVAATAASVTLSRAFRGLQLPCLPAFLFACKRMQLNTIL